MPFNNPDPISTSLYRSPSLSPSLTSLSSLHSPTPFTRPPKLSPSRSRRTSPARRPLHARSDSQTNHANPTIRVVEDDQPDVYSKTPFPSQPSQILSPRNNAPGYVFEGRGARVSDATVVANAAPRTEPAEPSQTTLVPKPLQPKKAIRASTATSTSDADTLVAISPSLFTPSASSRFSQGTTPPTSPPPFYHDKITELDVLEEQLSQERPTIRPVPPSASSNESLSDDHALTPRAAAASIASSSSSSDSLDQAIECELQPETPATSQPVPQAHQHTPSSGSEREKQASSANTTPAGPVLKTSTESFGYSDISYESGSHIEIHYPVVRQPSVNSLWAETQLAPPAQARMNNRASAVHHWSSQLSTIASESDRGSRSIERRSQQSAGATSLAYDEHHGRIQNPQRQETVRSATSSENVASDSAESSVSVPAPLFSPITRLSDGRDSSEEHKDTISPLQSPPLKPKRSGFLRRRDSDSRSTRSSVSVRPSSSQSDLSTFISSTIPAWARVYYRRGEQTSLGVESATEGSESYRLPTATSGRTDTPSEGRVPPWGISRPRNRPHLPSGTNPDTNSMALSEDEVEQEIYVIAPRRPISQTFTPRLQRDRRSTARMSAWKAPSLDEQLGTLFFSRQNRQILLFCLGFLCPLAWMLAAVLPLPRDPSLAEETPSQLEIERRFAEELGPLDDRSYQKAMWWRNLNRVMAALGTLLVGVIIALAIVASRMKS